MGSSESPAETVSASRVAEPGLVVTNLLNDLAALGPLLDQAACERMWLDAYLLAAGMSQIVDDYLHDAPYPLTRRPRCSPRPAFRSPGSLAGRLLPARRRRGGWSRAAPQRSARSAGNGRWPDSSMTSQRW